MQDLIEEAGLPWWLSGRVCLPMQEKEVKSLVRKIPQRRKWHPTPVFLPGKSHGHGSLVGPWSPWSMGVAKSWTQLSN